MLHFTKREVVLCPQKLLTCFLCQNTIQEQQSSKKIYILDLLLDFYTWSGLHSVMSPNDLAFMSPHYRCNSQSTAIWLCIHWIVSLPDIKQCKVSGHSTTLPPALNCGLNYYV